MCYFTPRLGPREQRLAQVGSDHAIRRQPTQSHVEQQYIRRYHDCSQLPCPSLHRIMSPLHAQLDHIVILVPYDHLASPPAWLTDHFTISPGGVHADGKTENRLILFEDGVYIELIAFTPGISEEERESHGWGKKPFGIVDYAFTLPSDDLDAEFESLQQRWRDVGVPEELIASRPVAGGRTRPDGAVLEWKVATVEQQQRGVANFWCFDVTPRHLRVPLSTSATTHPSGSTGVGSLHLHADDDQTLRELASLFDAYLAKSEAANPDFGIATSVKRGAGSHIILHTARSRQQQSVEIELHFSGGHRRERKTVNGDLGGRHVAFTFT